MACCDDQRGGLVGPLRRLSLVGALVLGLIGLVVGQASGDADADEDGSTWFAVDVSELRAHFSASTIDEVSTSYERGWLQGWRDYNETQPSNGE